HRHCHCRRAARSAAAAGSRTVGFGSRRTRVRSGAPPAGVSAVLAKFVLGYVACHVLYFSLPHAVLQELIHAAIAVPAAAVLDLCAPAGAGGAVVRPVVS